MEKPLVQNGSNKEPRENQKEKAVWPFSCGLFEQAQKEPKWSFFRSQMSEEHFSYQNTWHGGTSHTCTVIYSYRMTSPKTGIHHWCWEHIPRDLKKKKDKQPSAYFPRLVIAMHWQATFQPLKFWEDLELKHFESQTVETGEAFLCFLPIFKLIQVHDGS